MPFFKPVIYCLLGITGDLARRKKIAALFNLLQRYPRFASPFYLTIVGAGSRELSRGQFRDLIQEACRKVRKFDQEFFDRRFFPLFRPYERVDLSDRLAVQALKRKLLLSGEGQRLVIDVSVLTHLYDPFCRNFAGGPELPRGSVVVFEKPIGNDLFSAVRRLELLDEVFGDAAFVWEHFLGKLNLRRLLELRASRSEIGSLWNGERIADIQLTVAEKIGAEGRRHFFLEGIVSDMLANHAAAMLAVLLMEDPVDLNGGFRAAFTKSLRSIEPVDPARSRLGQYTAGGPDNHPGYREEVESSAISEDEKAAALHKPTCYTGSVYSTGTQWNSGNPTPVHLRVVKRAPVAGKWIVVNLAPESRGVDDRSLRQLVMRLEPSPMLIQQYEEGLLVAEEQIGEAEDPEAYEVLLGDLLLKNDLSWFFTGEEVLSCWTIFQPLVEQRAALLEHPANVWPEDGVTSWAPYIPVC